MSTELILAAVTVIAVVSILVSLNRTRQINLLKQEIKKRDDFMSQSLFVHVDANGGSRVWFTRGPNGRMAATARVDQVFPAWDPNWKPANTADTDHYAWMCNDDENDDAPSLGGDWLNN